MKRVPLWRSLGFIQIDERATHGATIGTNVYNADGSLFAPQATGSEDDGDTLAVTLWSLVQEIPANVIGLAALSGNGYVVKSGSTFSVAELPDSAVPFFIPDGETYTVAANKQALFALPIELDGDASLVIDGALVEVD